MSDDPVDRRGLFHLIGALTIGVAATTMTKILPKKRIQPVTAGQPLTADRLNEIIERVNNG